jgi:hypothetical protein
MTETETDEVIEGEAVEVDEETRNLPAVRASEAVVARGEISVDELVAQAEKIQQVMSRAMRENVHYGKIPGVNKPTLLKPGAEMLNVLLRLSPSYESEKIFQDGGHLTVISLCTLTHIPTSLVIAQGEGLCSTREAKYAFRQGGRTCPACGTVGTIKRSKFAPRENDYEGASRSDPPGWYCYAKVGGCGANFAFGDPEIADQPEVARIDNPDLPDTWNCVTPETRILTRDLRWVPAGDLASGDLLVGVQEEGRQYGRPYEDAIVTVGERFDDDLYEIRMEDGRTVRCNGEHRWLVKGTNSGVEWVSTATMYEGMTGNGSGGRPRRSWRILSTGVWAHEDSAEAGYLAGLLDADGSLDVSNHRSGEGYHLVGVSFAQQRGGVLDRLCSGLKERQFQLREYEHGNPRVRVPVVKVNVGGGLFEQMRLLGTVRPPRLLERWENLVDLRRRRFEGGAAKVLSISPIGRGELVHLGTTSHTYIAEGLVCHNTVLKMADKRALVAAVLNGTGASDVFTQDVEDQRVASTPEEEGDTPSDDTPQGDEEFDPGQHLLANAIQGLDKAATVALFGQMNDLNANVDWKALIGLSCSAQFEVTTRDELEQEQTNEWWRRLRNAVAKMGDLAVDLDGVKAASPEQVAEAFKWAFPKWDGEVPMIPIEPAPLTSEEADRAAAAADDDIGFEGPK